MKHTLARLLTGSVLATAVHAAWAAPASAAPGADTTLRFPISRFEVVGNTVLPGAVVDAALAPHAGPGRDFGDVQRALEALEAAYHARGYKLVTVELPEQELNGGVVRLNVVQNRIGRVAVTGNTVFDEANIRRSLPALQPGRTPDLDRVSGNLRLANENPAKKVTLKLQSGQQAGEVNALLEVRDERPWKLMFNLHNGGNDQTGETHASAVLQHANLFGRDHVGSVQYTTTLEEPSKIGVWGAGYHIPFYSTGDALDLYASYSNVDSGAVLAGIFNLAISGKGTVFGGRYTHVLPKMGRIERRLFGGLEVKAYKNSVLLLGQDFGNDVTVRPLSLGYAGTLAHAAGETSLSVTYVRNLGGGSRGGDADFGGARFGAKADFSALRAAASYTHQFAGSWQARLLVNAQHTRDALVPGEQFGAGGAASVRGFEERALSTDSGVLANAELFSPNLCAARARWSCRALGFVDAARGSRNQALPGEVGSTAISSAGLGLRVALGEQIHGQIDWGHVLDAGAVGATDKNKVHFRVGLAY
ncbi:ShlB/FhaC/HecB family hemolysin secretion/activation protein [Massilia glaciei]|uniref:ShlB/FhaC/HecB family hemolysin secretion/activation protein n=1 Tax=Massilia glaciei TaxID=1524097 RepID=A0A2U2HFF5_9BURK|nr:ShlB/FhaC/HecB family hemolysin secretion/activation protein [Massilia glaciei]PWF43095.1 ShlB/FhaC/HecB family hemolysin secretion/activation protein [Massilia glaciei]